MIIFVEKVNIRLSICHWPTIYKIFHFLFVMKLEIFFCKIFISFFKSRKSYESFWIFNSISFYSVAIFLILAKPRFSKITLKSKNYSRKCSTSHNCILSVYFFNFCIFLTRFKSFNSDIFSCKVKSFLASLFLTK